LPSYSQRLLKSLVSSLFLSGGEVDPLFILPKVPPKAGLLAFELISIGLSVRKKISRPHVFQKELSAKGRSASGGKISSLPKIYLLSWVLPNFFPAFGGMYDLYLVSTV